MLHEGSICICCFWQVREDGNWHWMNHWENVCQLYESVSTAVDVCDLSSFSSRNNWMLKSYLQHEEPYINQLPGCITRSWHGIRISFLTLSYHQQQPMDLQASPTVTHLIKCGCKNTSYTIPVSHKALTALICYLNQKLLGIGEDKDEGDPLI